MEFIVYRYLNQQNTDIKSLDIGASIDLSTESQDTFRFDFIFLNMCQGLFCSNHKYEIYTSIYDMYIEHKNK